MNTDEVTWKAKANVSTTLPKTINVIVKVKKRKKTFKLSKRWERFRSASFSPPRKKCDSRFIDETIEEWWGMITLEYLVHTECWRILWWKTSDWKFTKYRWYGTSRVLEEAIQEARRKDIPVYSWNHHFLSLKLVFKGWKKFFPKWKILFPRKKTVPAV